MSGAAGSDVLLEKLLTLHPKVMDLSLGRLERLLERLGHPERKIPPVVHVAGTNGKGSTIAVIRAGLEAAGMSAHVYTSPHLARFHERIRLSGELISEPALAAVLAECEEVNGGAPITFFEITTAAAFLAFSRSKADYTLLEVGLGGRLDATNVIDKPALSVITPVSIDHQQYLGETLAEIAGEKAGILKAGVRAVISAQEDVALDVIRAKAERLGAPLSVHGEDWTADEEAGRLIYRDSSGLLDMAPPSLPGAHQFINAGAGVAALRALGVAESAVEAAPSRASWPARNQRLRSNELARMAADAGAELWLDGGHNAAAGEVISRFFAGLAKAETHLICSMLDTKDAGGFLRHFASIASHLYAAPMADSPAAIPPADLVERAKKAGLKAEVSADVKTALALALERGAKRVLICGSLYFAGEILRDYPE